MPGIYGLYLKDNGKVATSITNVFHSMGHVLHHRDIFISTKMSQGRLYIGKEEFPFQPNCGGNIRRISDSLVMFLEGAIFSYKDGNSQYEFQSSSDAFSFLAGKYAKGDRIEFEKINGEFVLGIYDVQKEQLIIANDRWGFRELYYYQDHNVFLFASEAKAILQYPGYTLIPNEQAISDFLNYGFVIGDRCFFSDIHLLPCGSLITGDKHGFRIQSKEFNYEPKVSHHTLEECADTVFQLLDNSITRRLRGRTRVATCLSGGLDSRIITAFTSNHVKHIEGYSFGYNEKGAEYRIAKEVSRLIPNLTLNLAKTSPDHLIQYLKWGVWISEGMMTAGSISPFFGSLVDTFREKNIDLLLGGFVGDLILGGSFIRKDHIGREIPKEKRIDILAGLCLDSNFQPFEHILFSKELKDKMAYYAKRSVEEEFALISKGVDFFPHQLDFFVILTRCRKNYNSNRGLLGHLITEEYYPFFDLDFFEYVYSLPLEIRMNHRLYKELYRKYFYDLGKVVWLKTGRSLFDNREQFWRQWVNKVQDKLRWHIRFWTRGQFNIMDQKIYTPLDDWYRLNRRFHDYINGILLSPDIKDRGFFEEEGIRKILDIMNKRWDVFYLVDRLLVVELWHRIFIDGEQIQTSDVIIN